MGERMYTIKTELLLGILAIATLYLTKEFFERFGIDVDKGLLRFSLTIALLGASMRVLEDAKILERNFLTVTPGVWYLAGSFGIFEILLRKKFGIPYRALCAVNITFSILLISLVFVKVGRINYYSFLFLIPLTPLLMLKDEELFYLLFFSALDSIVPVFSVNFFGYVEKHPIPRFLLEKNPFLYPTIRLFVSYAFFLLLDREKEFERLILYGLIFISASASIRSFIRVLFLV